MKIETERLILREFTVDDFDALKELATGKITPEEAADQIERGSEKTIR